MMRRWRILLAIFIVLVFGIGIYATAAKAQCDLQVGSAVGQGSEPVSIPVTVHTAPDSVASLGVDITYDTSFMTYTGYTSGDLVSGFDFFDVSEPTSGTLRVGGFEAGADTIPAGANGTLVELHFTSNCTPDKAGQTAPLTPSDLKDGISTWQACEGSFTCLYCVEGVGLDIEDEVPAPQDSHPSIPIHILDAPSQVASLGFDVIYDPAVLEYEGCDRGDLATAWDFFDCSTPETGVVRVGGFEAGADVISPGTTGCLVTLRFHALWVDPAPEDSSDLFIISQKDDVVGWSACPGNIMGGCPHCGDVNLDDDLTPGDALLAFQHYLAIADPPLDLCQLDQADVTQDDDITPADALCIFQKYLAIPSCLDGRPECPW